MNDWNQQPDPYASQFEASPYDPPRTPHQAGDGYDSGLPRSTNGTMVLILGIVSWFMCGLFTAIPGWLIARGDRELIKAGMMEPDSTLEAGYWINLACLGFTALSLGLAMIIFFFAFVAAAAGA